MTTMLTGGRTSTPMTAEDFLAGNYLKRADIVLMKGSSLFGHAIRLATRSPFSHAALVFLIPDRETGFERSFVIEAVPKGISFRAIDELIVPGKTQGKPTPLAVLRIEGEWFGDQQAKTVRGRMMDFVRAGYDWRTVLWLAWSLSHGAARGAEAYTASARNALARSYRAKGRAPANFICSGLVQYAFLRTMLDLSRQPDSPVKPEHVREVIFDNSLRHLDPNDLLYGSAERRAELLATTPEEISRAPGVTWKYLAIDGQVYPVANRKEAVRLLEG